MSAPRSFLSAPGGGGGGVSGSTLAELLTAGVPETGAYSLLVDHNGNNVRLANGDGTDWITHPARGWKIPTEMLEEGNYGFTVEAGTLLSGADLGDKISYQLTASNEPKIRWRGFGDNTDGHYKNPWSLVLDVDISYTGTPTDNTEVLMCRHIRSGGTYGIGGGLNVNYGNCYAMSIAQYTKLSSPYYCSLTHMTSLDTVGVQITPRDSNDGAQVYAMAWLGPHETLAGAMAHAAADQIADSGWGSQQTDYDWHFETESNMSGGGTAVITVTINSVYLTQHPVLDLSV